MDHYDDCPCDDCTFVAQRGQAKLVGLVLLIAVLVVAFLLLSA